MKNIITNKTLFILGFIGILLLIISCGSLIARLSNRSRVDSLVMCRDRVGVYKVDIRYGKGSFSEDSNSNIDLFDRSVQCFALTPDYKNLYYSDLSHRLYQMNLMTRGIINLDELTKDLDEIRALGYSHKDILAIASFDEIRFCKQNRIIKVIGLGNSENGNKIENIGKVSWNASADKLCVSTFYDQVLIVNQNGDVKFLCKGMMGTFSPVNPNQLVLIDPSRRKLRLITIDSTDRIVSDKTLSRIFPLSLSSYASCSPIWSVDGEVVYYAVFRITSSWMDIISEISTLECVNVKTHQISRINASECWWSPSNMAIKPGAGF